MGWFDSNGPWRSEDKLREVGTEFEVLFPPALSSSSPYAHLARYRVVAHERVQRFAGDPEGEEGETLEVLSYAEMPS